MRAVAPICLAALLTACAGHPAPGRASYVGTLEPFASEAVYFVLTDRFVNGDPDNDHRDQGGEHGSFDIPVACPDGVVANIGYLGGDFRGLLEHAGYIRQMGFTAVWITPIVDNPDQAFSGGDPVTCTSFLTDRGKAGYHGYWGVNFFAVDEHLQSPGASFAELTRGLRAHGLKTVLDVVANHGSPAWSMPVRQPKFGQIFDADGRLVADHQNLHPTALDPAGEPLHRYYNTEPDLAQLADLDAGNPAVLDYLVAAHLKWIGQGVDALRIDTLRHQPPAFWREFTRRIRAAHPGMYLFGEAFEYEADKLAAFTREAAGAVSVLDFPLKAAMVEVFGRNRAGFERLAPALHLEHGPYRKPYELATFYDNHDMARMDAPDSGFIDAHNWLFTARGIPVVYYGSEIGFMRGRAEHAGNRNYYGVDNIARAAGHPIRENLARIAHLRAATPALQRGLQLNLELAGDRAAFYRVVQHGDLAQIALVLLNKGDAQARFQVRRYLEAGQWRDAFDGSISSVSDGGTLDALVPAHGVRVLVREGPVTRADLRARLRASMAALAL